MVGVVGVAGVASVAGVAGVIGLKAGALNKTVKIIWKKEVEKCE